MSLGTVIYQGALTIAGLLCLGVATYAWQHRQRRGATLLVGVFVSVLIWIGAAGVISQYPGTGLTKSVSRAQFVGITGAVLFLFLLSLRYTGREEYITRTSVALLLVEPIFINVAVWAPPSRDLVLDFAGRDPGAFYGYTIRMGPLFLAHTVYSYVLLTATAVMLVGFALNSEFLYQRQIAVFLVAVFAPWVGNALYLFGPANVDLTPVAFAITGLALWWAIFRQDFLEIVPVARSVVVDNIGAGVFVLDRENRVVDINPTGREMLGLEATDAIGMDATALLAGMPAIREQFTDMATSDAEVTGEVSFGGSHYQVRVRPLEDSAGTLMGRLFLVNDVTAQQRRQRELERQNDQLEQFASVVSHDLRNPLNVASAKLELGRLEDDDQELAEAADALDRIDAIIDDVLTLAREGKQVEERTRCSLQSLANRAWRTVETPDATLGLTGDRELVSDEQRLLRVFENLFRNALEHGCKDATVTVGPTDGGFFVADDGPGIPADQQDDVFEDGFTTNDDGTGFGLSIVESIVEAHGWEIAVTESESGGARFDVTDVASRSTQEEPTQDDGQSTRQRGSIG
ncbi:MAG: histidine kinase N-terminal 7TM domain-containing protein [Halorientalis sp.]